MPTVYELYKKQWRNCQLCDLCKGRKRTVLFRGMIPSKVMFIGEAPAESEEALGQPFVGPAGHLLNDIIKMAGIEKYAMTNIIACVPRDEWHRKVSTPPKYAVLACADRLNQIVGMVHPMLMVLVGSEAKKWVPKVLDEDLMPLSTIDILHPAFILRANISQRGLMIQKTVVTLADAYEEAVNGK